MNNKNSPKINDFLPAQILAEIEDKFHISVNIANATAFL